MVIAVWLLVHSGGFMVDMVVWLWVRPGMVVIVVWWLVHGGGFIVLLVVWLLICSGGNGGLVVGS